MVGRRACDLPVDIFGKFLQRIHSQKTTTVRPALLDACWIMPDVSVTYLSSSFLHPPSRTLSLIGPLDFEKGECGLVLGVFLYAV